MWVLWVRQWNKLHIWVRCRTNGAGYVDADDNERCIELNKSQQVFFVASSRLFQPFTCLFSDRLSVRAQARRPVLQGGYRTLPQLQCSPLCRAQRPHALPGLADRRGAEQLLHLDGEAPPPARWSSHATLQFCLFCQCYTAVITTLTYI